ncbi:MAG TPA: response regulator [Bacillales bacterium]|nr:response regulator [Bacillales bacterium]
MSRYKIMIADDEEIERLAMRNMLAEGVQEAEVIAEAANGREAVALAAKRMPDVVFMDIKMPGMDGVEAVKRIREAQPDVKFIMVSAFDTFAYAREVMKEGVKDYLLKPSKKEEIWRTVRRVLAEVESERAERREREALEGKLRQAESVVRAEWVTALFLNRVEEAEAADRFGFIDWREQTAYAAVCRVAGREQEKAAYEWLRQEWIRREEAFVGPLIGGHVPVLVPVRDGKDGRTVRAKAVRGAQRILADFEAVFADVALAIGMGTEVERLEAFSTSCDEALMALDQTNANVRVMMFHASLNAGRGAEDLRLEQSLLEAVHDGQVQLMLRLFDKWAAGKSKTSDFGRELEDVAYRAERMTENAGVVLAPHEQVKDSGDIHERVAAVRTRLLSIAKQMDKWQHEHAYGTLEAAKRYMEANFQSALTLEETAEHVGLSPYYFSKLFKERSGTTFIDYVTDLRLKQAKQLLRTSGMSLKEICYACGYGNPNYFSRLFKKRVGCPPSEYRSNGEPQKKEEDRKKRKEIDAHGDQGVPYNQS